jgi:cytochrome bd-type quinol oxidase subunit 2
MSKRLSAILIIITVIAVFLVVANFGLASSFSEGLKSTGAKTSLQAGSPQIIAAQIVKTLLTLIGVLFIALIMYSGFRYLTSAGNEEKIKKAKQTIISSVIGLIIIVTGYSITYYITTTLENPGQGQPPYNASCESGGTHENASAYYSVPCCIYRYNSYGNVSKDCCEQTSFCKYNSDTIAKCKSQGVDPCP